MSKRRDHGSGSVYQRKRDGRWVATIEAGWTGDGTRRRRVVTAKTEAQVKRKLRELNRQIEQGNSPSRATIRSWSAEWLGQKVRTLSPKAYRAAESPIRLWVIPTIGHRRLADLTPGDIRAVHDACRTAGRQAADVHRALHTMLEEAVKDGHTVPGHVLKVKAPKSAPSDRAAMTVDEGLACIAQAGTLDHGTRWLVTLLYGIRQGEALGLTEDAIDLNAGPAGEFRIEWQLQALPYLDRKDKARGFRIPDGYECRHLIDAWHLVRPKSKAGFRVAPLLPPVREALERWLEIRPENPWGLVWPTTNGRPANGRSDDHEWYALQATAGISHSTSPRAYYVHECRNFAATMLLEAGVPEHVVTDLLGHSTVATSLRYRTVRREPLYEALARVGERLQLG